MEAFFAITISLLLIRSHLKRRPFITFRSERPEESFDYQYGEDEKVTAARNEIERQRNRDIEDLRKQGYSEELIATIIPIINED